MIDISGIAMILEDDLEIYEKDGYLFRHPISMNEMLLYQSKVIEEDYKHDPLSLLYGIEKTYYDKVFKDKADYFLNKKWILV